MNTRVAREELREEGWCGAPGRSVRCWLSNGRIRPSWLHRVVNKARTVLPREARVGFLQTEGLLKGNICWKSVQKRMPLRDVSGEAPDPAQGRELSRPPKAWRGGEGEGEAVGPRVGRPGRLASAVCRGAGAVTWGAEPAGRSPGESQKWSGARIRGAEQSSVRILGGNSRFGLRNNKNVATK